MSALPARLPAHEIPPHVTVLVFVKPDGQRLQLLVRVPLEAIRDVEFPLFGEGYLDLAAVRPLLAGAARLWIADYIELYEGDHRLDIVQILATRISLPSDLSFRSFDDALRHVRASPLPDDTQIIWQQALLDVLFEYPIASQESRFSIEPALAHLGLRTVTVLRFRPPGGVERAFSYVGDPGRVHLDPRWHQAAFSFVRLGFFHILEGIDHLLFLLCLVVPFRKVRPLVMIVTSFTVAHSITLIASAFGFAPGALWFPPLIEVLIALSIVWMAFENIVGPKLERRWLVAFGFGLVHGFGFSFLLRESLQFAGGHIATSLLTFNIGVELGQLLVLVLLVPVLEWSFRHAVRERIGIILISALIAHTAWHWMTERGAALAEYRFTLPAFDLLLLAGFMRALMLVLVTAGALWLLHGLVGWIAPPRANEPAARTAD
jgi:hypothetical protein